MGLGCLSLGFIFIQIAPFTTLMFVNSSLNMRSDRSDLIFQFQCIKIGLGDVVLMI